MNDDGGGFGPLNFGAMFGGGGIICC